REGVKQRGRGPGHPAAAGGATRARRADVTTTATDLMTAEQFFDWVNRPENAGKHYELERGRVVEVSRPGEAHGSVAANFTRLLLNYAFARKKGYVCSNDTGVIWERSPDSVRGPD